MQIFSQNVLCRNATNKYGNIAALFTELMGTPAEANNLVLNLISAGDSGQYHVSINVDTEQKYKNTFVLMVDTGSSDVLIYSNECQRGPSWLKEQYYCPQSNKLRNGQITLNYKPRSYDITLLGRVSIDGITPVEVSQVSLFYFLSLEIHFEGLLLR